MTTSVSNETTTNLSTLSIVLVLAPSTLALVGVLWSTWRTARQAEWNERVRAQAAIGSELFAERRRAELAALKLVAETARALHHFHESMYGNTGKGKDDRRSAKAQQFEADLKSNFDDLVDAIRDDFGVDTAHNVVWGAIPRN